MKKILFAAVLLSSFAEAALFSISGNHRFGSNWFYNLDTTDSKNNNAAGTPLPTDPARSASNSTSYLEHRLIIRPDIIVDERFSIRTEFSLISQNNFDVVSSTINQHNGGAALDTQNGNTANQDFAVRAAYLKWNSDIGIFRAGRMHKGWGLGLLYDAGTEADDDASSIVDRMSFEGQLGSLVLTLAFEKYEEGSLYEDIDDEEVYEGSVRYENESAGAQIGLLFGRHIRGANSTSRSIGSYSSSNEFSLYGKKDWETFSIGAEVGSVAYDDQSDVYGGLAQLRWNPGNWNLELDGLYSSENGGRAFIVHPNYRPFLILYRQALGSNVGVVGAGASRYGRSVGFDPGSSTATESGAMLGRLGIHYNFLQKYKIGLVGGYAQMLKGDLQGDKDLGMEADLIFEQRWYDNFKTSVTAGALLPGSAFPGKELVWGGQIRSYLNF